jgi:hypothetical protein
LEIARALQNHPDIKLRMGIHSGPVYRSADINANQNVAGGGVNFAQRVMDCGDAGHILLSRRVAEDLSQISAWVAHLYDLGECAVKHGERVHLFNLFTGELGNPELPQKMRDAKRQGDKDASLPPCQQVALPYKRNAQPDEQLLKLLEAELVTRDYRVFIDRHLTVGVEWAKEIERQVRTSDTVIPLLSAAVHSEMLSYEIQIAHEAAEQQQGKPRILPVRVNYDDPLPEPLAGFLERQMGKTSLLARGIQQAREAGAKVVLSDFQKLNVAHLASLDTLFLTLARSFMRQLNLDVSPDKVWDELDGPNMNFEGYLRREVLEKTSVPIVWEAASEQQVAAWLKEERAAEEPLKAARGKP